MAAVAESISEVEEGVAALGSGGLSTDQLAMRRALQLGRGLVLVAVSADSHRCYRRPAAHRNGRSSKGPARPVFVGTVGQQERRVSRRVVAGTAGERTSATIVCLWIHCCRCESGNRGLAVGVAVGVGVEAAGPQGCCWGCCWRPRRWCSGCPPTPVSDQTGIRRSRLSRSCRGFRLALSRILSADGGNEMA